MSYLPWDVYSPIDEDFPSCFYCEHPMLKAIGPWVECHHCPACRSKTITPYAYPHSVVINLTTLEIEQP